MSSFIGHDEIIDAAFRRAGIIRVNNFTELKCAIHALVKFVSMKGPRLGIITPSGAGGIIAIDACQDYSMTVAELPEGLARKLKKGIPDWIQISNPIDIWPVGMLGDGYSTVYNLALTELLKSPKIDAILGTVLTSDSPLHKDVNLTSVTAKARQETKSNKPIALWLYGSGVSTAVDEFELIDSVACFDSIEEAVQGLSYSYRYHKIKRRKLSKVQNFAYKRGVVDSLLLKGKKQNVLFGKDALTLLSAFGIPVIRGKGVQKWKDLEKASQMLTFPMVLKLSGEGLVHKIQGDEIVAGIRNKKELRDAYKKIKANLREKYPNRRNGCFQLQEQAPGKELILVLKRDPDFGFVLACGLGGLYAKVFKDISCELVPLGRLEAEGILRSLKIYPLLEGVRGELGVDWEGMVEILRRLAFLATKVPDISELEVNPLMADASGCRAVDARILF